MRDKENVEIDFGTKGIRIDDDCLKYGEKSPVCESTLGKQGYATSFERFRYGQKFHILLHNQV